MYIPPKKLKPGDELTTTWLNSLLAWVLRNTVLLGLNSGITAQQGPNGITLRVNPGGGNGSVCKTTSNITARTGATPGTGTVEFYIRQSGVLTATGRTETVYSYSSTVGGIPSGVYGWVAQDDNGDWWIISADCN